MAKILEIAKQLIELAEEEGNIEMMMQSTTLSNNGDTIFDSTVETLRVEEYKGQKVIKAYWQM
jgi:ribosomal protein S19E (S16A)